MTISDGEYVGFARGVHEEDEVTGSAGVYFEVVRELDSEDIVSEITRPDKGFTWLEEGKVVSEAIVSGGGDLTCERGVDEGDTKPSLLNFLE